MHVPVRPPRTPQGEHCVRCDLTPGHDADLAAWAAGYAWTVREPLPGLEPPFWICASCAQAEAEASRAANIEAGYVTREEVVEETPSGG